MVRKLLKPDDHFKDSGILLGKNLIHAFWFCFLIICIPMMLIRDKQVSVLIRGQDKSVLICVQDRGLDARSWKPAGCRIGSTKSGPLLKKGLI
jgi:hypothetical protein